MNVIPKPSGPEEEIYLEGARSRSYETRFAFKVMWEFIKGFRTLHFVGPCLTVFGSARYKEGHPYYDMARQVGKAIANAGFTTMTGGGPGIMEAANRGAAEHSGRSVGVNILLPMEQEPNQYLDTQVTIRYFFVRKVLLCCFGTIDELFETLTLVQTRSIRDFPIVLMGKDYYKELWAALNDMVVEGTISADDLKLVLLTDDPEEAINHIGFYVGRNFRVLRRRRPFWWLFENPRRGLKKPVNASS
jgi:uncharacterized protein (TIGR00730 family)